MRARQSHSAADPASGGDPIAALAEIRCRQDRVVESLLVPLWYWWVLAAAMIAIGIARDRADSIVQAIAIPLAVLVIAGLVGAAIPAVRRRVQVRSDPHFTSRIGTAIFALVAAVDITIVATAAGLAGAHNRYPATIATTAGAAVIVIAGPMLNWYARTLMLRQVRQQASDDAAQTGD